MTNKILFWFFIYGILELYLFFNTYSEESQIWVRLKNFEILQKQFKIKGWYCFIQLVILKLDEVHFSLNTNPVFCEVLLVNVIRNRSPSFATFAIVRRRSPSFVVFCNRSRTTVNDSERRRTMAKDGEWGLTIVKFAKEGERWRNMSKIKKGPNIRQLSRVATNVRQKHLTN